MIKYKLICKDCETTFDSWFSSSKEYEKLKKKKFLNCHFCNSLNVGKGLMSPNVSTSKNNLTDIDSSSEKYKEIKKIIYKYQEFIKKNFEYVGENFAYEARSLHYKDKKKAKGIYGTATKKDLNELKEEGIKAEILPWIKNTTN
ncbi:DUF1178 family protein [bacterium]|nr:DUF1178 family protein [Candidatus Pelagibacter ubique]MDA7490074.1 DUF1178 family protein [Candidatus Pelagibacter ubique]MDA7834256.1 DUF1178 family protein [bacterium]MDB9751310.1 DUF1178 family protein [Candidatus Pelagibacter ubique]